MEWGVGGGVRGRGGEGEGAGGKLDPGSRSPASLFHHFLMRTVARGQSFVLVVLDVPSVKS